MSEKSRGSGRSKGEKRVRQRTIHPDEMVTPHIKTEHHAQHPVRREQPTSDTQTAQIHIEWPGAAGVFREVQHPVTLSGMSSDR